MILRKNNAFSLLVSFIRSRLGMDVLGRELRWSGDWDWYREKYIGWEILRWR
jgi:hypothetical protein